VLCVWSAVLPLRVHASVGSGQLPAVHGVEGETLGAYHQQRSSAVDDYERQRCTDLLS